MDLQSWLKQCQHGFYHAEKTFNEALNALNQLNELDSDRLKEGKLVTTDYRSIQLVLEYRLSSYDALRALLQCQQSLWQVLGVSKASSDVVNYERLAYGLGRDDLHFLLTMLNQLADALLKLIARIERKNKNIITKKLKDQTTYASQSVSKANSQAQACLKKAIDKQALFTSQLLDLTQSLQGIAGAPDIGEVIDEISALKGPISRFYQALQNGMILAGGLYQQLSVTMPLTPKLTQILNEIHHALELATPHLEPQRFFIPEKVQRLSTQDLEERASLKRLRPFFS
ncbi:MAG: hypothetical protein A3F46_09305 [Legionellales bacterium RIFCSPHIGHO2_12_FULL_42_9]|nr:MAG: hypothetical protein A3F46_09305 [Legionellales bacterium RIFCSPHIGHO2_12_FULL_42_9]